MVLGLIGSYACTKYRTVLSFVTPHTKSISKGWRPKGFSSLQRYLICFLHSLECEFHHVLNSATEIFRFRNTNAFTTIWTVVSIRSVTQNVRLLHCFTQPINDPSRNLLIFTSLFSWQELLVKCFIRYEHFALFHWSSSIDEKKCS